MTAIGNIVKQTTSSAGDGNLTLASAVGYRQFANVFGTGIGNQFFYAIRAQQSDDFEVGIGYMDDATTLVRVSVVESSNADDFVDFAAGGKDIVSDVPAQFQNYLINIANSLIGTIGTSFDGLGVTISAGAAGLVRSTFAGTITGVTILADQTGSIEIDVQKCVLAQSPPDTGDSICGGTEPAISNGLYEEDTTLTGWDTTVNVGDVFRFEVLSATNITKATIELSVNKE